MNKESSNKLHIPAEWERQKAVQLTWPHADTDWKPILGEISATYVEMAKAIAQRESLIIAGQGLTGARRLLAEALPEESFGRITFHECPNDDTWARDHAFITLKDERQTRLLDFRFNGWGGKFPAEKDNAINRNLYDNGIVSGKYVDHNDFVLEGGSIESDGNGTIFTTSQCLTAPGRNQPLSTDEIEARLNEYLSAERIVWINHGHIEGDDTDGHIDTLVRIAPDNTLLYVGYEDGRDEELKLMEDELRMLKTKDGEHYRLLRLPMPSPIEYEGDILPATYANFLVINGALLVPVYGQKENDDEACGIIAKAFPDREIVRIDARWIIVQHGSVHCCCMNYF